MATIRRFQDVEAWQKARELTQLIYSWSREGAFARDFGLRDQIRRSCVSITSNIAEGFERDGNAEFVQFLSVAKGSASEVESQLYVALDEKYISTEAFKQALALTGTIKRMLAGLMKYLKQCQLRGLKFKEEETGAANAKTRNEKPVTRNRS